MKKILAPTDFSATSEKALPYLRDIYQRLKPEITFLHTYDVMKTASMFKSMDRIMQEDGIRRMERWKSQFSKELESEEGVSSRVVQGKFLSVVESIIKKEGFDLAVFGTAGVTGLLGSLEGSNTNRVLKNTQIPILAIPETFPYRPLKTVVLAVDDERFKSAKVLEPLIEIVKTWDTQLYIYHKDTGDHSAPALEAEIQDLPKVSHFHEPLDEEGVLESILRFCENKKADLLCMIRREQSFWESSLNLSTTSQSVFAAQLPLLILSEQED